ncbi:PQQ-binding-like beta-propeller repeat protein [Microbacterium radiodurans]|uniref:ABC transporter n=1 Tax=Microbacterium radiodurans TaxID=661398 RepID=A0A5J5IYB5_9MICO|nr:hypothetical protein [Microbacterium radiodurans]KAA9089772.1 hypothetical protein F6B42_04755 [Microbacterium radiodurans]
MTSRAPLFLLALTAGAALLAGCQAAPGGPAATADPASTSEGEALGDGHGAIAGARELAEPALHLTSIAADGDIHHLDLIDEQSEVLGRIAPADTLDSEGRFLFAGRDGEVSIVDSGVWTWNHIDHFHYYEAPARLLGELEGTGVPRTVTSDLGAGVFFEGGGLGGEAVLLDFEALKEGEIVESFRLALDAPGAFVVPLPGGALIADPSADELRHVDATGDALETIPCDDPAGSIATNVGVVVGCADGAVLAVANAAVTNAAATDAAHTAFERIPYPPGGPGRALSFAAREGRPTVAGRTDSSAFWLLDTRERVWTSHDAGEPIVRVSAVDDADETVVALAADGSVIVLSGATGAQLARTAPLVAASLADPALASGVDLVVDQRRTYLGGPSERALFELDPADGARVARTFSTDHAPVLVTETGR